MNLLIKFKRVALLAIFGVLTLSCSDDDNNNDNENTLLVEAQSQTSLTTFVEALERAELDVVLNGTNNLTVYAPTNSAFTTFLGENGYASINDVPVETLRDLLLNHTMNGSIETTELLTGFRKTMATGDASITNFLDMYIDTSNGIKLNGISTITTPDIDARNGYLHIVDKVIELPTVMTFVKAHSELSTLETALGFNPLSVLDVTLAGNTGAPYTLFAPINSAFSSYLTETGLTGFAELPEADLQTTLQYHVGTNTNALSSGFTNNQSFSTMAGQDFTITLTGGGKKITDVNSRVSTMTKTDIQATNGVVHLIDKVLMPNL